MSVEVTVAIIFVSLVVLIFLGLPIAFVLGGLAIVFAWWLVGPQVLFIVASNAWGGWTNFILIALPLYVLMGCFLQNSGLADDLYEVMYQWFGGLKGGLAAGTVVVCTIFAAMTGVSAVACITLSLIALPSMLKRNYDKHLAVGCIAGGSTLGILIPPSIPMIVYGSIANVSVGKLFMAGIIPGLTISAILIIYILTRCYFQPQLGPALSKAERISWRQKLISLLSVIPALLLIVLVLGVIYAGIATPTEAAGIGAFGALICLIIQKRFTWAVLNHSFTETLKVTGMAMWIYLGALCFTAVLHMIGAQDLVVRLIKGLEVDPWIIIIWMQLILLVMGCFMDVFGITLITMPIFAPIVSSLGFDLIWFGVLFTINMEVGFLTPPFGFNLFYLKATVPPSITMPDIYRAIAPFVFLLILGIAVIMLFPQLALWLPSMMITR